MWSDLSRLVDVAFKNGLSFTKSPYYIVYSCRAVCGVHDLNSYTVGFTVCTY